MQLSQEEIVLNLFNFHKMVVSNIGYPVYQVEIKNSEELEILGINLKQRQNLCIIVYLSVNDVTSDSCYFVVNPVDKSCYSYCFYGINGVYFSNRQTLEQLGIDIDYWNKKFNYKRNYEGLNLADIFAKLLPSNITHWEHMKYIIGCDIDWYEELFKRPEKSLNILEKVEKYVRLTTDKFKTTL